MGEPQTALLTSHSGHGLEVSQALSLSRWYSKHMTRSQAEQLLKQEVSVWPQVNGSLFALQARILNWGLAAVCTSRQGSVKALILWGPNYTLQGQKQWGCSSNVELGSEIRVSVLSWVWAVGMLVAVPFPPDGQLLFPSFQGKEGGFIVRDSSKAGKYTVSVFAKSTGWVLLF